MGWALTMLARAVIGTSYGDEGKGRTVDWLATPDGPAALVVRSNGGAQAGHSVVAPSGTRHVFHHIGAGALRGARTHLSRFMVSHPMLFADECAALSAVAAWPVVSADPRGWVTTPWDMMLNQAGEEARGGGRHGSCGLGFGETIERCEVGGVGLRIGDLGRDDLPNRLCAIRDDWLPRRCEVLGLPMEGPLAHALAAPLLDRFVSQCRAFAEAVALRDDAALSDEPALIFEGAQGLLLDQGGPNFPHVTRSHTGMRNVAAIAREAGIDAIAPLYVTRPYLTRHGRGPMEDERAIDPWYRIDDPTNRPNPWQETLRFGLLDPAALGERIAKDIALAGDIAVEPALAVSCLDQIQGEAAWRTGTTVATGSPDELLAALTGRCGMPIAAAFAAPSNTA